jgi:transcriptional regulator with XRE-family HTH domain
MLKKTAWAALPGATPAEKLATIGITVKKSVDIRKLGTIAENYGVPVYLFFEEDLARNRSFESVLAEFGNVPEYERPVILVESFLRFTQENDPSFEQTMEEFPLMVGIIAIGEAPRGNDPVPVPYVTCLMPFLDELDLSAEPPQPGLHAVPPAKP